VNAGLSPGWIVTDMARRGCKRGGAFTQTRGGHMRERNPWVQVGLARPEDIAAAVAFLVEPGDAGFVTAQVC